MEPTVISNCPFTQPKLDETSNSLSKKAQDEEVTMTSVRLNPLPQIPLSDELPESTEIEQTAKDPKEDQLLAQKADQVFDFRLRLGLDQVVEGCRKKFEHLLPPYLSARISRSHLSLLNILDKIDSYLQFQRDMRGVKHVLFSQISRNLFKNFDIESGLHNLKQILYLDPEFYEYCVENKKSTVDIRISISRTVRQTAQSRKATLRRLIFRFLDEKHDDYLKLNSIQKVHHEGYWDPTFCLEVPIPEIDLPLSIVNKNKAVPAPDQQQPKVPPLSKTAKPLQLNLNHTLKVRQDSLQEIMNKGKVGESFKQKLYRLIGQKEQKNKQEQIQRDKLKQVASSYKLSKTSYLKIVDQVALIYTTKRISNIFQVTLVDQLMKRTCHTRADVDEALQDILATSKYLEEIKTDKGIILKINKAEYPLCRGAIQNRVF